MAKKLCNIKECVAEFQSHILVSNMVSFYLNHVIVLVLVDKLCKGSSQDL